MGREVVRGSASFTAGLLMGSLKSEQDTPRHSTTRHASYSAPMDSLRVTAAAGGAASLSAFSNAVVKPCWLHQSLNSDISRLAKASSFLQEGYASRTEIARDGRPNH